jgi:hypothetical protein
VYGLHRIVEIGRLTCTAYHDAIHDTAREIHLSTDRADRQHSDAWALARSEVDPQVVEHLDALPRTREIAAEVLASMPADLREFIETRRTKDYRSARKTR